MSSKIGPDDDVSTKEDTTATKVEVMKPAQVQQPKKKVGKGPTAFKLTRDFPTCMYYNPIAWLLIAIDCILIFVTCRWRRAYEPITAKIVTTHDGAFCLANRKISKYKELFNCKTAYDLFDRAFKRYSWRQCMGTRSYLGTYLPVGARFPLKMFGETKWITYQQAGSRSFGFGMGLLKLGMVPLPKDEGTKEGVKFEDTTDPHTILIYEDTCADWMCAFAGAMSQSLVVATSYATLGVDAIISAVKECNVKIIVCNRKDVKKLIKVREKIPTVTCIIYTNLNIEPQIAEQDLEYREDENVVIPDDLEIRSFRSVADMGGCIDFKPHPPTRDNMAVIMYVF